MSLPQRAARHFSPIEIEPSMGGVSDRFFVSGRCKIVSSGEVSHRFNTGTTVIAIEGCMGSSQDWRLYLSFWWQMALLLLERQCDVEG